MRLKLIFITLTLIAICIINSCSKDSKRITYLYNKTLPLVKDNWSGNILIDNKFYNIDSIEKNKFSEILKWQFSKNPQKAEKEADTFRLETIKTKKFITDTSDMIVWLGHAAFFIRISEVTFLTDPCYNDMFLHRLAEMPCTVEDLKGIDYLLVSHNHRDHLSKSAIKILGKENKDMKALIPLRMGEFVGKYIKQYSEAGWYQQFTTSDKVKVYLMPSKHWSRRGIFDGNSHLWGSFIIQANGKTIFFAGDTGFSEHFEEIAKLFPSIDYGLIPVGSYMPQYIMHKAHIAPWEAVDAANILHVKKFIPMHYATYDLSDEPIGDPVRRLIKLNNDGKINGELTFLKIGEKLLIPQFLEENLAPQITCPN